MNSNQSNKAGEKPRVQTVTQTEQPTPGNHEGARIKNLAGAFTRYVKMLNNTNEPSHEDFQELWDAFRVTLIAQLRKYSLWCSSPSYLGVFGYPSWTQPNAGTGQTTDALDELMVDCYSHVFLKRLQRLQAQLEVKPEIDGLVILYIRNFIHDRRKAHDPMGFRVFETLRTAIRESVSRAELVIDSGDPKLRSNTVLAFPNTSNSEKTGGEKAVQHLDLEGVVRRWNNKLLPGIMTAVGPERQELLEQLRGHILELESMGVRTFRLQDLADPLKRDVRARWATILEQEGGETVPEENGPEVDDSFKKLDIRVAKDLKELDVPTKTRQYLVSLWGFLGTFAANDTQESLPSNRKVSAELSIPRERLPGLYETLGEVIG